MSEFGFVDNSLFIPQGSWEMDFLPSTVLAELPTDYTYTLPQATVPVASGSANSSFDLGGILKGVSAGGNDLLKLWGGVRAFDIQSDQIQAQAAIAKGQIAMQSTQAQSAVDIAKTKAMAEAAVEKSRAEVAMANASHAANNAKAGFGTTLLSVPSDKTQIIIGVVGLALAAYGVMKSRGGK